MGLFQKKGYKGFDWDDGNSLKNWITHKVSQLEIEEAFSNDPFYDYDVVGYLRMEKRRIVESKTNAGRLLFIVYTERRNLVRAICARDAHQKERKEYEERTKTNS
jgi:uncharacterized DUF497 family protein